MKPKRRNGEIPADLATYTAPRWRAVDRNQPWTAYCDALIAAGVDYETANDRRADAFVVDLVRRLATSTP